MTWHHRDPRRLSREIEIMRARSRAELRESGDGNLFWLEQITSESGRPYLLMIEYPDRFPFERPKAFFVDPPVSRAPHLLNDGSLCLFDDPFACDPKCTALVVRNRAVTWLLAYEVWQLTGEWAAPQHEPWLL